MPFVTYRKSDFSIVGFSGTVVDKNHDGLKEIHYAVMNFGGSVSDYGFIEITDEQESDRVGKSVEVQLLNGVPEFIIGKPLPLPPQPPTMDEEIEALKVENSALKSENQSLRERDAAIQDDQLFIFETLAANGLI